MEVLGGTSVDEAARTRWFDGMAPTRAAQVDPLPRTAEPRCATAFSRRLASLNAGKVFSDVFFAIEATMICLLGIIVAAISLDTPLTFWNPLQAQAIAFLLLPVGVTVLLKSQNLYDFDQLTAFSRSITKVLLCTCVVYCGALLLGYLLGTSGFFSNVWLGAWLIATVLGQTLLRAAASLACTRLADAGAIHQNLAIYGDRAAAQRAVQALARADGDGKLVGVFGPDDAEAIVPDGHFDGTLETLIEGARANAYDTIIVAANTISDDDIRRVLGKLENVPCAVQIFLPFKNTSEGHRSRQDLTLFDVQEKPISGWGRLIKRFLDVVLASVAMIGLAPILLLVAAAIKLDSPGPVFFAQRRHGLNRRVFRIFKLRTMTVMEDGDRAVQAARKDARVTRIGAILRKTSIDELPQLLNVLRGEMSLVGPRPHPLSLDNQYADELATYSGRHKVKPGITGWAQINGHRGPTDQPGLMQRRVQHDLDYIENWSFWLDLKIIAATPFLGIIHKNAV